LPEGAIPCQEEDDPVTGHFPHWVPTTGNPYYKWHRKAFDTLRDVSEYIEDGTYELCGEHFKNNADELVAKGSKQDVLVKHGECVLEVERTFEGIKQFLKDNEIEGIVFHRDNGDMCKIKRSDFGMWWVNKR